MSGWIKINDYRLYTRRIVSYEFTPYFKGVNIVKQPVSSNAELDIHYFNGLSLETIAIKYHAEHHTKRLDALFNIERSPNAKVPKTDARPVAAISRR